MSRLMTPPTIAENGTAVWMLLVLLLLCVKRNRCKGGGCCSGCRQTMNVSQDGYDFIAANSVDQNDLAIAQDTVNALVTSCISQPQFDALVDYCYFVGPDEFAVSDVLALVNACDFDAAAAAMAWSGEDPGRQRADSCFFAQKPQLTAGTCSQ